MNFIASLYTLKDEKKQQQKTIWSSAAKNQHKKIWTSILCMDDQGIIIDKLINGWVGNVFSRFFTGCESGEVEFW